ncbi:MAG: MATE family efflux transporter [Muribaculaceae bacterium]|nr:MATE family efflux transporter [Muribaculaceae bacterium]
MSEKAKKSATEIDMLHGPLFRKIIVFALPLLLSGVMQQSFNSVDIAVVGKYCSPQSLAAVGSNGMVVGLIVNLFLGISIGANVVIANYIGSGRKELASRAVATAMTMSGIFGVCLALIGITTSRPLLEMIGTPEDVIDKAVTYLRIFYLGVPFLLIFNFGSAVLRSVGDTRRPFYCLMAGGLVNVGLNLLLVLVFDMDVAGVAVSTSLSNLISAALLVWIMSKEEGELHLDLRHPYMAAEEANAILRIGVPAGVQAAVFPLSNVFILSAINTFGSLGAAGSAAALNFEYYCYYVIAAFVSAAGAFTGQNYGARNRERCDRVFRHCLILAAVGCALCNLTIVWQKGFFTSLFTDDMQVAGYAYIRIKHVLMFQFLAASYEIAGASMRGMGYSVLPAVIAIFGTCIVRIIWVAAFHHGFIPAEMGTLLDVYPFTWVLTGMLMLLAYIRVRRCAFARLKRDENTNFAN